MVSSYYKDIYELLCKRHPNKKIYVISDHHFYHLNIIKYNRTDFTDIQEMNKHIIKQHNNIISSNDIVIFLGDFCFKKNEIKNIISQMNGHKYLLLGNHDQENLINCYGEMGFEGIFTNPIKVNNNFLSHHPLRKNECDDLNFNLLVKEFQKSNGVNYHGHIHTEKIHDESFINVCCEIQDYKPLLIGYTADLLQKQSNPLIINSNYFEDILKYLKEEKQLEPSLIISDYLYSLLLEYSTPFENNSFIYGSFPLYKKYGYISNFSDLDVALIYDDNLSNGKNQNLLKQLSDQIFEKSKRIDNINLSFNKRMTNLRIFEFLYTNLTGNSYRGYYDVNLVPLNIYKDTDFSKEIGYSTLEKILKNTDLLEQYHFPQYESRFLTINGDIANIILKILFQSGSEGRKVLDLKKLKYIYRMCGNHDISNVTDLEDIMTRFLIRNMLFFHTTNRKNEIDYINEQSPNINDYIDGVPATLKLQIKEILNNPNSLFNKVHKELAKTNFNEIPIKSKELIKELKNMK